MVMEKDVTKLKNELDRTKAALKDSEETLQKFAYKASHDLGEPLRTMRSYVQLIERRYADKLDKDGKEFIDFVVDGANRMSVMLEALVSYSRVTTRGKPFVPTDCGKVFSDVMDSLKGSIEASHAVIEHDPLPSVTADASQLCLVFWHLIDNAIKFRGEKEPRISVSASEGKNEWVFSVTDNGPGIDPKDKDRVFDVFEKLHGRDIPGTGAGLAISKRIIARHGGRIWVESGPGKGSAFYFTIPGPGEEKND